MEGSSPKVGSHFNLLIFKYEGDFASSLTGAESFQVSIVDRRFVSFEQVGGIKDMGKSARSWIEYSGPGCTFFS